MIFDINSMFWFERGHLEKNEGKHRKDHCLDKSDENFEEEKREWQNIGHEVKHYCKQDFSREDIPK